MRAIEALGPAGRTALRLGLLAGLLWGSAWALAAPAWTWALYRQPLGEILAHRLAGKLWTARAAGPRAVLVVGASSAREGFDEQVLGRGRPGWRFVNAGLAGGSVRTLALAELMLRRSGARPAVIVLALHPFFVRALGQDLVALGYTDFFDALDGAELLGHAGTEARREEARGELLRNALFPPRRHARLLGRRLRAGLWSAHHAAYWGRGLERAGFEVVEDDTRPMAEHLFDAPGEGLKGMLQRWERAGLLDPAAYRRPGLAGELDELVARLGARGGRLVLALLPEHAALRARRATFAPERFERSLADARRAGARVLDYAALLPDEDFLDLAHVGPRGRERLSRALAADLAPELEDVP